MEALQSGVGWKYLREWWWWNTRQCHRAPLEERWLQNLANGAFGQSWGRISPSPCGFPSEGDVGLTTWKAWCSGTCLGFRTCLNAWSPSVPEPSDFWKRGLVIFFWFLLFCWFLMGWIKRFFLPWGCVLSCHLMWPTLQKSECSKNVRTSLIWSVCLKLYIFCRC